MTSIAEWDHSARTRACRIGFAGEYTNFDDGDTQIGCGARLSDFGSGLAREGLG